MAKVLLRHFNTRTKGVFVTEKNMDWGKLLGRQARLTMGNFNRMKSQEKASSTRTKSLSIVVSSR